jgi:hypothetical protein
MKGPFYVVIMIAAPTGGVAGAREGRYNPARVMVPTILHTHALCMGNCRAFRKVVKSLTKEPFGQDVRNPPGRGAGIKLSGGRWGDVSI